MNHRTYLAPLAAVFVLMLACGEAKEDARTDDAAKTNALPEHEVSELAQLMRDMTAYADSTKARLGRGEDLLPYPADFARMTTAVPTPGMVDHRTFDPFAFAYLKQLDSLYKVPVAQREQAYDELIQYCAACHGQVCPGPLVRIKKLRMPQPVKPEGA